MPKAPILSRDLFYYKLRDGSYALFDWCLVNTSLGAMIEPRQLRAFDGGRVVAADAADGSFTRISEINPDQFFSQYGTSGPQISVDYNT